MRPNSNEKRMYCVQQVMYQWLKNRINCKKIDDYLKEQGIHRIAIYGLSDMGELLFEELRNSEIEITCCIDKNYNKYIERDFEVISCDTFIKRNTDETVIVTAIMYYEEIKQNLCGYEVVSLEDIINELGVE